MLQVTCHLYSPAGIWFVMEITRLDGEIIPTRTRYGVVPDI